MDETQKAPQQGDGHPAPQPAPQPVMDVVPPKPAPAADSPEAVLAREAAADAAEAPKEEPKDVPAPEVHTSGKHKKDKHPKEKLAPVNKPPKQHGSGVGLAVFATIIIVLGLGAMFVYAYLRSQNISVF